MTEQLLGKWFKFWKKEPNKSGFTWMCDIDNDIELDALSVYLSMPTADYEIKRKAFLKIRGIDDG